MAELSKHVQAFFKASVGWELFVKGLRETNRFPKSVAFAEEVLSACLKRNSRVTAAQDASLFRARVMPWERRLDPDPYPVSKMGAPPPHLARSGRLNPEGIPYLYLASDEDTALAEVRPWVGANVTVAEFQLPGSITAVDLKDLDGESDPLLILMAHVFGRPTHRDDSLGYLGTQFIAERLKKETAQGVMFDSALRPGGWNLTLFNPDLAHGLSSRLLEVTGVKYTAKPPTIVEVAPLE